MSAGIRKLATRAMDLATDETSPWTPIPSQVGVTVRRTWTHPTPEHMHRTWPEPTFTAHAFLTLAGGKPILGTCGAPWTGRQDREVPLWLAEAILDDPELAMDTQRQIELRRARRAARAER